MTFRPVLDALAIPAEATVVRRVPKTLLLEQDAVRTAADKRRIQEGIDEIVWVATLKPTTIGVPAFEDNVRQYLEISVLTCALRNPANPGRIVELIHRAIPYPVVLVVGRDNVVSLSLAHKRWSHGEAGAVVADTVHRSREFQLDAPDGLAALFLTSLAIARTAATDLYTLYDRWVQRIEALAAADITGSYVAPSGPENAAVRREALESHERLTKQIAAIRAQAGKEKQIRRRVDLNVKLKRLEEELAEATTSL